MVDYEPAGELKIGQVGIANLRVRTLDVHKLCAEMRDRVARAPKLFARAAVVVDFGGLLVCGQLLQLAEEGGSDAGVVWMRL